MFSSDGQKAFELMIFGPQIVGGPIATIFGIIYILWTLSPMALLGMFIFALFYILQVNLKNNFQNIYVIYCIRDRFHMKTVSLAFLMSQNWLGLKYIVFFIYFIIKFIINLYNLLLIMKKLRIF